ncbi:MAG: TonB family protein, partial [Blastocatellia bacterium]
QTQRFESVPRAVASVALSINIFGIGSSVNRFLLDKMAEHGRGEVEYVSLQDDGSAAARRFHERVRNPPLTDIEIDWAGLPVADVYPKRLPDLFSVKPLILTGRYTTAARGVIRLRGKWAGQNFVREIPVELPESQNEHDVLATLWARTRIDDLMSQDYAGMQNGNAKPEAREAITQLGLEYRLMTQFTSFVAVEEMTVTDGGQPRRIDVPVEMPEGVSREGVFGADESKRQDLKNVRQALGFHEINIAEVYTRSRRASKPKLAAGTRGDAATSATSPSPSPPSPPPPSKGVPPQMALDPSIKVSGVVLQGSATRKVQPAYPAIAKAAKTSGAVQVQITVNESGEVINAQVINGHPSLRDAALQAAKQWRFKPTQLSGKPVKTQGVLSFNFAPGKNAASSGTVPLTPLPEEQINQRLRAKLHPAIAAVIERLKNKDAKPGAEELKFTRDGKAEIQVWLTDKSAATIEQLKKLGFEVILDPQSSKVIIGRAPVEKLSALAELDVVKYIAPQAK